MSNQKPFHVYWHNPSILVFKFDNLSTTAAQCWNEQCLKYNGHFPNPLRTLYDFSECGAPSPYWIKNEAILLPQLILPSNLRTAYYIANDSYRIWTDVILARRNIDVGPIQAFTAIDEAVDWLMQGLDEA